MHRTLLAAACLAGLSATPALAVDRDFDLTNATGYPIREIYIDEASKDHWTDNAIEGVLDNGDKVRMQFGKSDVGCAWDMKVVWTDNTSSVWKGFNLCQINSITLKYNRSTDSATAVTD